MTITRSHTKLDQREEKRQNLTSVRRKDRIVELLLWEVVIRFLEPVYQATELGLSVWFLWQLGVSGYALLCRFEGRLRSSARVNSFSERLWYDFWSLSIRRRSLDFLFDFCGSWELADTRCFAGSKDDCDLLLELEGTPSASSRFLDACFITVAATSTAGSSWSKRMVRRRSEAWRSRRV
jgi:hypothetical protein